MKKSYKLMLSLILVLPVFSGFAQSLMPNSELPASRFEVDAEIMDNDTWCRLLWPGIYNYDELAYDDGEADDFFIFSAPGGINANKFTPLWYPAEVTGGEIYVGNSSFPGPFLGTQFRAMIFDDNGPDGLPGTVLDSMDITVENYYWVEFEGMSAIINSGSFYLGMKQLASAPDAAPIGVDTDNPTYFISYSYLNNTWMTSPLQDFMIRARVANGNINEDVDFYQVDRFSGFDPNGSPLLGDTTFLGNVTNPVYNDHDWAPLPMGWYAYGVKEHYVGGGWSEYNLSNLAGHMTSFTVTIFITLCDTSCWESTVVKIDGEEVPAELTPGGADVTLEFNSPFPVLLDISVYCPGNDYYHLNNIVINENKVYNILLSCTMYPARNLAIDPVSLIATWDPPQVVPLEQNFEGAVFPPQGWQMQSQGSGWYKTEDGSGGGWNIPGWNSNYACTNDLLSNGNDGSMDYLVTPANKLDYRTDYVMRFHSYFDGFNSQDAYVKYSTDGENWEMLYEPDPITHWEDIELSLSPFSGPDGPPQVWFAFHSDDNGQDGSGWAVDNIRIFSPDPPYTLEGYYVYINDSLFAITESNYIDISPLEYGESYTISVKAHYPSGLSAPVSDTVFCEYLYPPTCFYFVDTLIGPPFVICPPEDTAGNVPSNLLGFNIYMNSEFIEYFQYTEEWGPPVYYDWNFQPGIYQFSATAVYDLTPFGYPGETGESMSLQTAYAVSYGYPLPFLEQWNSGTFETNNWLAYGPNWSVNWQEGQPDPSAEFTWDPIQSDYSISLESYPLLANSLTEGDIYLDFDLKLDNNLPSGTEQMLVQVWNWEIQTWTTVQTYTNGDGSFDWMSEHLDITSKALKTVFKIRFLSIGENSLNIVGWHLDNIHVYRECKAPYSLITQIDSQNQGIELNWNEPFGPDDSWVEWDDGVNSGNSIGIDAEVEFDCAARWEPSQLSEYEGSVVERVAFFPAESQADYRIRVWIGAGAANMVVDQLVENPVIGQWNDILLTSPINIDITQELWVGYHVEALTGYPAGVDDGPAIDGYGNMMNYGGWQTLLQLNPELNFNWNIKAYLHGDMNNPDKYAIYRSDGMYPYFFRAYSDTNYFLDDSGIFENTNVHCYQVSAIYPDQIDTCESSLSNESCEISWTVNDYKDDNVMKIYPNPASEVIFIESSEKVESVRIFDGRGITIEQWNNGTVEQTNERSDEQTRGHILRVPVKDLAPGIYLVRVDLGDVMINRKVIIKH